MDHECIECGDDCDCGRNQDNCRMCYECQVLEDSLQDDDEEDFGDIGDDLF